MLQFIQKIIQKLFINALKQELFENRVLLGKTLAEIHKNKGVVQQLSEVEFKVFSQWGDDGIIQYLIQNISIPHKTFIEFGVETYTESNTRFLLTNNNWSGFVMDGSRKNIEYIQKDTVSWKHDLQSTCAFITAENINELLAIPGFNPEVGILSIDIDGNDYYVWKNIHALKPVIVISEFNSVFGKNPYSSIYDPAFFRTTHHHSNLLYGSSLTSLCDLAEEKGYAFLGCNSAGNNAYFVRKDKVGSLPVHTVESGYVESKFKESRHTDGSLSYLAGKNRLASLKGCKVFNTRTQSVETL